MNKRKGSPNDPFEGPAHRIFNEDGKGTGVWNGAGTTRTSANSTLFVTNITPPVQLNQVEALFKGEPGFFAFRTVRRMAFIDFKSVPHANLAMRKYQHYKFPQWADPDQKLLIDYDKDPKAKRNQQFEKQWQGSKKERKAAEQKDIYKLFCGACAALLLSLRIPAPKTLSSLPKRKTDDSIVVQPKKYMVKNCLKQGVVKKIKRDNGLEMQYRFVCPGCALEVGYQSVAYSEEQPKHIFLLQTAVVHSQKRPSLHIDNTELSEQDSELQAEIQKVRDEMQAAREAEELKVEKEKARVAAQRQEREAKKQQEEQKQLKKEKEAEEKRRSFFDSRVKELETAPTGKMKDVFTAVYQSHGPGKE